MEVNHRLSKFSLLLLAVLKPAAAVTVQLPSCEIIGDPDIYGIGVRIGFYLQWAALVFCLFFKPKEAVTQRTASTIMSVAIYIVMFRNMNKGSLVAIDYPILWYLTSSLNLFNFAWSKKQAGWQAIVLIIWSMYNLASPWVNFVAPQQGRQPGCDVKYVIFVPISAYSRGLSIYLKIGSVSGVIVALVFLGLALWLITEWLQHRGEDDDEEPNRGLTAFLGFCQFNLGVTTIIFAELTLRDNHVKFPNTRITDTSQLIPLIIGIFTFVAPLVAL